MSALDDKSPVRCRIHIPTICEGTDIVIGVDEAGRGCVLGSLIYSAVFWPASENDAISKLGFDDSKALKESERDSLFHQIINHPSIGWVLEEITAATISKSMLKTSPVSLNRLSFDGVVRMLASIRSHSENPPTPSSVFVDTVGDPEYYKSYLRTALGDDYADAAFTVEKKADAKYRVVSAASIVAKVTRDRLLNETPWQEKGLNLDRAFGSGYPSDELCVQWMERSHQHVFSFPAQVRHSWGTCREMIVKKRGAEVKWECDEDDGGSASITSFFGGVGEKRMKRCAYFSRLKMRHLLVSDLQAVLE